jgi:hypothetical protein
MRHRIYEKGASLSEDSALPERSSHLRARTTDALATARDLAYDDSNPQGAEWKSPTNEGGLG